MSDVRVITLPIAKPGNRDFHNILVGKAKRWEEERDGKR
jgi:hypothetical protein